MVDLTRQFVLCPRSYRVVLLQLRYIMVSRLWAEGDTHPQDYRAIPDHYTWTRQTQLPVHSAALSWKSAAGIRKRPPP